MRPLREIMVRLFAHLRPGAADREIAEEMRYHLDRQVERNVAAGMAPVEALHAARRAFGNVGGTAEAMREAARWSWVSRIERDLRYAVRALRRAPLFALTVVLTIAVAIGLNTTVFTLFDAYVLRQHAVRDPSALHRVSVVTEYRGGRSTDTWMDWAQYQAVLADTSIVAGAVAYRDAHVRLNQVPSYGALVTGNYFQDLGVNAVAGRPIIPDDVSPAGDGFVVVLSHRMWQSRFGGDSAVIGKTMGMRGRSFTIVGVIEPKFTGFSEIPVDFWAPVTVAEVLDGRTTNPAYPVYPRAGVIVRLRPGIVPELARERIGRDVINTPRDTAEEGRITGVELESRATVIPLSFDVIAAFTPVVIGFGLVLVVSCANVANMMLARGLARQRELGIRMALGAGRRQVIGQLLAESAVLAVPAAILGFVISRAALSAGVRIMMASFPPALAPYLKLVPLGPDLRIFLFLLFVALAAAVLFGLAPALQVTRTSVVAATRGEFEGVSRSSRLRNALVVTQMAGCVLLMIVAGVLVRGATALQTIDAGFSAQGLVRIVLSEPGAASFAALRAHPLVMATEAAEEPPAQGTYSRTTLRAAGSGTEHRMYYNRVSRGFFDAVRTPLRQGRTFTDAEVAGTEPVVIISETAARMLSPSGSALGLELKLTLGDEDLRAAGLYPFRSARVIGVARDAVAGLVITRRDVAIAYFPMDATRSRGVFVKVRGDAAEAARTIEMELDRQFPGALVDILPTEQAVAATVYPIRAASWISGLLGVIALALTLSGIYGVLSYLVAQRTREIGIRMSLGANARSVVQLVLGQSLRLAMIGGGIGVALALVVSGVFSSAQLAVTSFDAVAYVASVAAALTASLIAAWVPSRRAAAVSPLEAIRSE